MLGGLVVYYEDLERGGWQEVRDYVGFELSEAAIRTNPPDGGPRPVAELSPADLEPLRAEVEPLAEELGYSWEGSGGRGQGSEVRSQEPGVSGQDSAASKVPIAEVPHSEFRILNSEFPCPPKLCTVLVPVADRIEPACEAALRQLERRGYTVVRAYGYRQIDLARNQMATDALAAGCQETLWIDADTGFDADAVEQLRAHREPIICGIYPKKGKRELAIHVLPGTKEIVFGAGGGLIEILYAATGFLLVRREVYEKMERQLQLPRCQADTGRTLVPYFAPLVRPDGDGCWYLADDFAFSERARQCGYRVMADSRLRLWHLGSYAHSWEDAGRGTTRFGTYRFHLKSGDSGGETPD